MVEITMDSRNLDELDNFRAVEVKRLSQRHLLMIKLYNKLMPVTFISASRGLKHLMLSLLVGKHAYKNALSFSHSNRTFKKRKYLPCYKWQMNMYLHIQITVLFFFCREDFDGELCFSLLWK